MAVNTTPAAAAENTADAAAVANHATVSSRSTRWSR